MNSNWKLIGALALLVASVAGAVVYFSLSPKITEKSQKKQMQYQPILKDKAVDISVGSSGAVPSSVKIKNGWMVRFVNNDALDLKVEIKGKTTLVVIGKEKEIFSGPYTQKGVYKFRDINNSKITGEIVVEDVTATVAPISSSDSLAQQKASIIVDITKSGFSTQTITVGKGATVQLKNSTSSTLDIDFEKSSFQILSGKTYTLKLPNSGQFKYVNKSNNQLFLIIVQ